MFERKLETCSARVVQGFKSLTKGKGWKPWLGSATRAAIPSFPKAFGIGVCIPSMDNLKPET